MVVTEPLTVHGPPCVTAWVLTVTLEKLELMVVSVALPAVWRAEVDAPVGRTLEITVTAEAEPPPPPVVPETDNEVPGALTT